MMNSELNKLVDACLLLSWNDITQKDKDLKVELKTKISSLGQSALKQLNDFCSTSEGSLDGLAVDDVCLLTSVLSKQEDPALGVLALKASYAQDYLNILKGYDNSARIHSDIDTCIEAICKLFQDNAQDPSAAIAHFIDSREIGLEKISIKHLSQAISFIRTAIVDIGENDGNSNSEEVNKDLYRLLEKGKKIEFLKIKGASLRILPSLPNCKSVFLFNMENLREIDALPECTTFYVKFAKDLCKIESIPKCISLKCVHTPHLVDFPPCDSCKHFYVIGDVMPEVEDHKWKTLGDLPSLKSCMNIEIMNVHMKEPVILHGLAGKDSKDVNARHGVTADCIGFRETTLGKIYIFKVKDAFNHLKIDKESLSKNHYDMLLEKYPAVEIDPREIQKLITEPFKEKEKKICPSLGYNYFEDVENKEIYFTVPSLEVLKHGWEQLREMNQNLPDLKIFDSNDIATNSDFVNAYFVNDFILSSGIEFLHDQFFHALPTLFCMCDEKYVKIKNQMIEIIKEVKTIIDLAKETHKIEEHEHRSLEHMLGYFVDLSSANLFEFFRQTGVENYLKKEVDLKSLFHNFLNILVESPGFIDISEDMKDKDLSDDIIKGPELWKKIFPELNVHPLSD